MITLPSNVDQFILDNLPGTCPEIAAKMERVFTYRGTDQYHFVHTVNKHMNSLKKYGIVRWDGEVTEGRAKIWVKV